MFDLTTSEKITKAKISLTESHPFWGYLAVQLFPIKDTKGILPEHAGMGVNARGTLIYKKEFVDSLQPDELKFVIAHEVNHLAFGHLFRIDSRDPQLWNIATDIATNYLLICNEFVPPECGLIPDRYSKEISIAGIKIKNLDKKTSEQIYDELYKKAKKVKGDGGAKGFDHHQNSKDVTPDEAKAIAEQWKDKVVQAATAAREKGDVSGSLQRLVDGLVKPKLNWKQIIRKFLVSNIVYDYSFSRPSRKFHNLIMPGPIKESVDIVVHIDSSGSISESDLQQFLSECTSILTAHRNVKMVVIECDCEINQVFEVTSMNVGKLRAFSSLGGGGTSHVPMFEYVKKNIPRCNALVSLTDLYSDVEQCERPKYPVIFVSNGEDKAPWGKVIKIDT